MGFVRRRARRRTMLVAGGAAYAAGRATRGGPEDSGEPEPEEVPAAPPVPMSAETETDQLQKLAELHDSGALTDDEFAAEKAKILGA
jgi:hypothetical protein